MLLGVAIKAATASLPGAKGHPLLTSKLQGLRDLEAQGLHNLALFQPVKYADEISSCDSLLLRWKWFIFESHEWLCSGWKSHADTNQYSRSTDNPKFNES